MVVRELTEGERGSLRSTDREINESVPGSSKGRELKQNLQRLVGKNVRAVRNVSAGASMTTSQVRPILTDVCGGHVDDVSVHRLSVLGDLCQQGEHETVSDECASDW